MADQDKLLDDIIPKLKTTLISDYFLETLLTL